MEEFTASKYAAVGTNELTISDKSEKDGNRRSRVQKWKFNVKLGFAAAVFVFLLNLSFLILIGTRSHYADDDGVAVVFAGDCNQTRKITFWSHLGINILGSILLAAGNTCMQCLTAPTRKEINQAHARHIWLDIGVHTVRNLRIISSSRRFLWACLALSSFPLHLLYNSVIFEVKVVNDYIVAMAPQSFVNGGPWNHTRAQCFDYVIDPTSCLVYLQNNVNNLVQLDNAACIEAYGPNFISDWANVLVITDDPPFHDESVLNAFESRAEQIGSWVCDGPVGGAQTCENSQQVTNATEWVVPVSLNPGTDYDTGVDPLGYVNCDIFPNATLPAKYCLAQPTPEACRIGVSPGILLVVLICNFVEIVCLFWTFCKVNFEPLVTLGDAISSFLDQPDSSTSGCGVLSATDLSSWITNSQRFSGAVWNVKITNGFGAASKKRWLVSSILFIIFWISALILLITGTGQYRVMGLSKSLASLASDGIGHLNVNEIVAAAQLPKTIEGNIILANMPQLTISLLYLLYNDLFTRVHLATEWSSFARIRKPLYVLSPRKDSSIVGKKRMHYGLSLPLRISIPLLILTMALHWLVSQSLFLGIIGVNDYIAGGTNPVDRGYPVLGLGWSPFALILSLTLGGVLILGLWIYASMIRIGKKAPLVRSCSAAISAACHPPTEDNNPAEKFVMYGVVQSSVVDRNGRMIPGHVCFTSNSTTSLVDGELYR